MAKEDIELTFDEKPFQNSIDNIVESMENLNNTMLATMNKLDKSFNNTTDDLDDINDKTKKNAKNQKDTEKNVNKVAFSFKNILGIATKLFGIFAILKTVMGAIPELGITFKIIGNIIQKNLLWPLRQLLIPWLQKIVDWAKNNRSLFVKIGTVIRNVFIAAGSIIKQTFDLLSKLVKSIQKSVGNLISISTKKLTEMINVTIFKIVGLFTIMKIKLEGLVGPLGKFIGEIIKLISKFIKSFTDSFLKAFQDLKIMEDVNSLFTDFKSLIELITPLLEKFSPVIEKIAEILGTFVSISIKQTITGIKNLIQSLNAVIKLATGKLSFKDFLAEAGSGILENVSGGLQNVKTLSNAAIGEENTNKISGLLTGVKNPVQNSINNSKNNNRSIGDITISTNVTVQGNTDPENVSKKTSEKTAKELYNILQNQYAVGGIR
jgi:phage-related protein